MIVLCISNHEDILLQNLLNLLVNLVAVICLSIHFVNTNQIPPELYVPLQYD